MPIVEVQGLTRSFGDFTAVDGVSFEVQPGEIFGFLGPNGAGKSTTINMVCTLLKPTAGTARVNGFDVAREQDGVRRSIGLIFQEPTLDERLTGWQNLQFHAMLYDVPPGTFEQRARELLEMVELTDKVRRSVKTYSGGMKRRLEIVLGLLHHPKVLFLDEPTIGLDPQTRLRIWEYVKRVRDAEGLTLFLTTHYMDEAEVCDRIAVIDHGGIVACDSPDELKSDVGEDVVTFRTTDDERAVSMIAGLGHASEVTAEGVRVVCSRGAEFIPDFIRLADGSRSGRQDEDTALITAVDLKRPTLDDVFVRLTGRDIREEEVSDADEMRAVMKAHMAGRR